MHRVLVVERWSRDDLNVIQATPWQWSVPSGDAAPVTVIAPRSEEERARDAPDPVAVPAYGPKRVYLRKEDMEKWGYTARCRRCQLVREGRLTKMNRGVPHTAQCRKRLEDCLKTADDPRLREAEDRINTELANRVEEQVARRPVDGEEEEERRQGVENDAGEEGPAADEPEQVVVEEDLDEDMVGLLTKGMPTSVAKDFVNIYELFLISGAAKSDAKAKVCELFSPPELRPRSRACQF